MASMKKLSVKGFSRTFAVFAEQIVTDIPYVHPIGAYCASIAALLAFNRLKCRRITHQILGKVSRTSRNTHPLIGIERVCRMPHLPSLHPPQPQAASANPSYGTGVSSF